MSPVSGAPLRPRLADHVLARRHVVGGTTRVVLHDTRRDARITLGRREWALLAFADGTRDGAGLLLAARREGVALDPAGLAEFLEGLAAQGLLVDGTGDPEAGAHREGPSPSPQDDAGAGERPVRPLPGYRFACDGPGECCGQYPTVLLSPLDVVRARAALPEVLDGGARALLAFTPERGSAAGAVCAAGFVDGRCAYQRADGLCGIHAVAGLRAKPIGCQLYPLTFVDDGESVRVSVVPECGCAFASAAAGAGEPLVGEGVATRAALDPAAHVERLHDTVRLAPDRTAPLAALATWSLAVHDAPLASGPASLLALADAVERVGLDPDAARASLADPAPADSGPLARRLERLARLTLARAAEDDAWRAPGDRVRRTTRAIALAATAVGVPVILEAVLSGEACPAEVRGDEAFYVRAGAFGHHWVGARPLAAALRDRAARLVIARAIALGMGEPDPQPHPLARVEAVLRTHGFAPAPSE